MKKTRSKKYRDTVPLMAPPKVLLSRETRDWWPLLTVETEVNADSKSTNDRGPSLVAWLVVWVQEIFFLPWLLLSHNLAPPPPPHLINKLSLFQSSCASPIELSDGRGGGVRSQIIQWRESLVLYKSLNNLWFSPFRQRPGMYCHVFRLRLKNM